MFFFIGFLPFALLLVLVIALLAGRSEPDVEHERPRALYLAIASYIAVLFVLGASFLVVQGAVGFSDDHSGRASISRGFEEEFGDSGGYRVEADHDDDASALATGLITGVLALGVVAFHLPKLRDYETRPAGPGARVYARYLYLVCFAGVVTAVTAGGAAIYQVLAAIAPDTFGNGDRADAFRTLASLAALTAVAVYFFLSHWRRVDALQDARRVALAPPPEDLPPPPPPVRRTRARKAAPPAQ